MIMFGARTGHTYRSMASGLLRSMLSFVLTDSTFTGVSERSKVSLQQTKGLIKKVSEEAYIDRFDEFAAELVTALESISEVCPMSGTSKTVAAQREKLWKVFHEKRTTQLPDMWKRFLQIVDHELDPLVCQSTRSFLKRSLKVNLVCNQGDLPKLALLVMRSVLFDTHQDIFLLF